MTVHIMIVDDEQPICESLSGLFEDEGYLVSTAPSGEEAVARFRKHPADCIFLDIWMPGIDGLETMTRLKQIDPDVPVIMMSGHATIDTAVRATRQGAFDFIEKPFSTDKLLIILRNAIDRRALSAENSDLKYEDKRKLPQMIGHSAVMKEVRKQIDKASTSDAPILIMGEHGTGKSVVARLIHEKSKRQKKAYVKFKAAAFHAEHMYHELMGYEKGAFAGALHSQRGRLEAAHQGTTYFESVTDLTEEVQEALIKVMQEKRIQHVGSTKKVACDVRVIMGTHLTQQAFLSENRVNQALYAKTNGAVIYLPKLKQHLDDIPDLLAFLAKDEAQNFGEEMVTFSDDVIEEMQAYHWPGNVRELRNYVERCHILCPGQRLTVETMLPIDGSSQNTGFTSLPDDSVLLDGFHDARKRFERSYIEHHLEKNEWNVSKTAMDIGMERSQLHRKIKAHDLIPPNK